MGDPSVKDQNPVKNVDCFSCEWFCWELDLEACVHSSPWEIFKTWLKGAGIQPSRHSEATVAMFLLVAQFGTINILSEIWRVYWGNLQIVTKVGWGKWQNKLHLQGQGYPVFAAHVYVCLGAKKTQHVTTGFSAPFPDFWSSCGLILPFKLSNKTSWSIICLWSQMKLCIWVWTLEQC